MKVLVCHGDANDASSFYRSSGPWAAITRGYPDIRVTFSAAPTVTEAMASDVLFLLRPCQSEAKRLAEAAKHHGVRVWADYDDDLLQVPTDNPNWLFYSRTDVRHNIRWFIENADVVTTSTEALSKAYVNRGGRFPVVVPNAIDNSLLHLRPTQPGQKIVLWRGSPTHDRDVASVADEIVGIAAKHRDWAWAFVGADPVPWACSERIEAAGGKVIRIRAPMSPLQYYQTICALRPLVAMAPLADNAFNRSKSCIAALEASFCGAVCIGRSWDEWTPFCGLCYEDGFFSSSLRYEIARAEDAGIRATLWCEVARTRMLTSANKTRLEVLVGKQGA